MSQRVKRAERLRRQQVRRQAEMSAMANCDAFLDRPDPLVESMQAALSILDQYKARQQQSSPVYPNEDEAPIDSGTADARTQSSGENQPSRAR